ncbi:protein with 4 PHD domains plus a SET domain and associated cysteine cluster at the C-terminus [Cryptosporidium ryanae]|uniref:protein with 4 PHD domains plus a SET domain and associated cysteine cluster at the C-terminus n=1 Tax=Cryptosporidium ryanae TaxID=515981 RepID=UPI003519F5EB|nr:protein with 4 PHD domains plus a SET domain and associated cysteine cluster at the C-terminus [Cryptosporidium ryanae]
MSTENSVEKVSELLDTVTTSCSTNELVSNNSFGKEDFSYYELFESDHWDEYYSESELSVKECNRKADSHCEAKKNKIWNDNLEKSCGSCNYVENYSEFNKLIKCEGFCRKPYHLECAGLKKVPENRWKCSSCLNNLVYCNICNNRDSKLRTGFLKCYHPLCMRYFHTSCLINPDRFNLNSKFIWRIKNSIGDSAGGACMQHKIYIGSIPLNMINVDRNNYDSDLDYTKEILREYDLKLICSRHFCDTCKDVLKKSRSKEDEEGHVNKIIRNKNLLKLDDPDDLEYCIRCNTSYHYNCLHPDSIRIAKGICICSRHVHDETDILTREFNMKDAKFCNERSKKSLINLCRDIKSTKGVKLSHRIEILNLLNDCLDSSLFESVSSSPFELPGQSKDWVSLKLETSSMNNDKLAYRNDYGFIEIKKNIYAIDDELDCYQDQVSDNQEDVDDNEKEDCENSDFEVMRNLGLKNSKKRAIGRKRKGNYFLFKQITSEKCVCSNKCDKDTCQNAAMFIECNSLVCGLDSSIQSKNCMNRIFNTSNNKSLSDKKRSIEKNLKVFDAKEKGLGVYCQIHIPKDTFVVEYVGEVLKKDQYLNRVEWYKKRELKSSKEINLIGPNGDKIDKNDHEFAFNSLDIRERHWYCMEIGDDYIIDSTRMGNISRLINHSCEPNCVAQKWIVGNEYRIGIFSLRDINPNEELTYDYSFTAYDVGFECKCNTKKCKGRIGAENLNDKNIELIRKRNILCRNNNIFNSFSKLNKTLHNNPILYELGSSTISNMDYYLNNCFFVRKNIGLINEISNMNTINRKTINEYNIALRNHILGDVNIFPYDFKYRNSLYGYTCLLYSDSDNIINDWYTKKSKNLLLMSKPWSIFPFVLNSYENNEQNLINVNCLKRYNCKRVSIYMEKEVKSLNNNSLFWYLFDNGIGSDDCCKYCNNPGTLITCDYCYDSFHKNCLNFNKNKVNIATSHFLNKYNREIKCLKCEKSNLFSVYWLHTPNKRRRINYFLKQKTYSLPLFLKCI